MGGRRLVVVAVFAVAAAALAQENPVLATAKAATAEPAPAEPPSPAAASAEVQPAASARQLTLDLAATPLARGPEYNAFYDVQAGSGGGGGWGWGAGGIGPGMLEPSTNPAPGVVAPTPLALKTALTFDLASEGKVQLRLFRVEDRSWDDLDTWEEIGAVTAEVSAVAGLAMLVNELFD